MKKANTKIQKSSDSKVTYLSASDLATTGTQSRSTKQRNAIRKVFEQASRPLAPEDILKLASKYVPGLGIATVYRNIKSFIEDNDIVAVQLPGEPDRYEVSGKHHHHHFHCKSCDQVFEVEGCPGDLKHLVPEDFTLEDHQITLYGACKSCK